MLWLWIIGVLAALLILLCRTRVGARAAFGREAVTVDVTVGPFHFRVFPGKGEPAAEEATAEPKSEPKEKKPKKEKQPLPKPTLEDIQAAVAALWPGVKKALGRIGRGIRVKPLDLSVTVGGGEDPAAAAQTYGYLHSGVWTAMPVLEQLLVIPDPRIHVGLDFDAEETALEGELGVSLRIGTLLAAAWSIGVPAVRWFLRYQKEANKRPAAPAPVGSAAE